MRPGRFYAAVLLLTLATLKERFPPEALARDLSCFGAAFAASTGLALAVQVTLAAGAICYVAMIPTVLCSRLLERAPGWRLRGEPRPEPEAWPAMLSAPTPPR